MQDVSLGGKIYSHQRPRLKRSGRRNIQNPPVFALDHCRKIQPCQMGQSGYIKLDLAQALFQIIIGEFAILSESRVVDEDVDWNAGAYGLIQHIRGCTRLGEIDGENQRTGAVGLFKFSDELPEFVRAASDENQVVAFARED